MLTRCFVVCTIVMVFTGTTAAPAQAAVPPTYPNSMLSAGDSITRGFDANGSCSFHDCPQLSWSTGNDPAVNSHYSRLLALNPALAGNQFNIARTGAKMADLPGQLWVAGHYKYDYVTVLMGGNDLCTSSAATMTSPDTFVQQYYTALAYYFELNPDGHVFISSIPDIYQLWATLHTNSGATFTWSLFKICQSMLASSNTESDRQKVVDQENKLNWLLATVCQKYFPNCRFDNYATYLVKFPASEVSDIDYFHPSPAGQANLAATTWRASYWGG